MQYSFGPSLLALAAASSLAPSGRYKNNTWSCPLVWWTPQQSSSLSFKISSLITLHWSTWMISWCSLTHWRSIPSMFIEDFTFSNIMICLSSWRSPSSMSPQACFSVLWSFKGTWVWTQPRLLQGGQSSVCSVQSGGFPSGQTYAPSEMCTQVLSWLHFTFFRTPGPTGGAALMFLVPHYGQGCPGWCNHMFGVNQK